MAKHYDVAESDQMPTDAFFGSEETVTSDLPRYAVNGYQTGGDGLTVETIDAYYEDSNIEIVEGKTRLLHRVRPATPLDGHKRVLLWGNYQLDAVLPTLDPGTNGAKVRISYKGKRALKGGRTLKEIEVIFSANAKRRDNPYLKALQTEE